jgi:Uma2 family endonuclease
MSALVNPDPPRLTSDEFLAWEEQQEGRHEFIDGEIQAMVGGTLTHAKIVFNLAKILDAAIADPENCVMYDESVKFRWDGDLFYPDVMVTCEEHRPGREWVELPVVLAEVLSPSTQARDRDRKWPRYQRVPSLQTFLLVAQHRPWVQVFRRTQDGWTATTYDSLGDGFEVAHPACTVALKDIYRRVPLPAS